MPAHRNDRQGGPLIVIANEGGLPALSADWGFDDVLLATAGPAEVDVRLRLAMTPTIAANADPLIQSGSIVIDEAGYSAKLMQCSSISPTPSSSY